MKKLVALTVVMMMAGGCAEPGETTGIASATGGAIGAGLGAIIGGQTGSTGAGLVIGAVSGAATGAAVGNAIEGQQQAVRAQDEAIERQEQLIVAQRREINALRQAGQDSVTYRPSQMPNAQQGSMGSPIGNRTGQSGIVERSVTAATETPRFVGAQGAARPEERKAAPHWTTVMDESFIPQSVDCNKARDEIRKSEAVTERADKLFHVRRALRFCPDAAPFHNKLGELYVELDRQSDAEFSFKEALRLRGDYSPAQANLARLKKVS